MCFGLGALFVLLQTLLDLVPEFLADDGRVLTRVDFIPVRYAAHVDRVAQDSVQVATAERFVASSPCPLGCAFGGQPLAYLQFFTELAHAVFLQVQLVDFPDAIGMDFFGHQGAAMGDIGDSRFNSSHVNLTLEGDVMNRKRGLKRAGLRRPAEQQWPCCHG